jgi:peptidoglycan/LPS O-acetylase OafA/YrhL
LQVINLKAGVRHESTYLHQLESLRGVAILLVFLFHVYGITFGKVEQQPSWLLSFVTGGNTGVTLFFVLSGFLLSLPWLEHFADPRKQPPGMINFYVARTLRIVPLYELAVVFSVLMTGAFLTGAKAAAFMFVGFDIFPYSVVWWTLATEVQFYIALPLAFWAWSYNRWTRALLVVVLLSWAVLYIYLMVLQNFPADDTSYFYTKSLFGRLPAFLIGIFAAGLYLKFKRDPDAGNAGLATRGLASAIFVGLVVVLGLLLRAVTALGDAEAEKSWHIHHSYEALLWAGMILCLVLARPVAAGVLVNRPLAIVGKLSYSLYLVHVPILFYLIYPIKHELGVGAYQTSAQAWLLPLLGLALSLGLSLLTYKYIELPFLNLKKRIPW